MVQNNNFLTETNCEILTEINREQLFNDNIGLIYDFIKKNIRYKYLYDNDIEEFEQQLFIVYWTCTKKFNKDISKLCNYCYGAFLNNVKTKLRKKYGYNNEKTIIVYSNYDDFKNLLFFEDNIENNFITTDFLNKVLDKKETLKLWLDGYTAKEIASKFKVSRQSVDQKIKKQIKKIKEYYYNGDF